MVRRHACRAVIGLLLLAPVGPATAAAGEEREAEFLILEQRADVALTAFAQQAGVSVLFPYDAVSQVRANRLAGVYSIDDGLQLLLEGTGLEASLDGNRMTVRSTEAGLGPRDDARRRPPGDRRRGVFAALASTFGFGGRRAPPQPEEPVALEEIVVTGSRIRRDDFGNAQPTTVISGRMIESLGIVNLGDAFSVLPSNVGSYTPTAKPGGNESFPYNIYNGLNLANLRGLNPTYGSRTLTLIDSRRHVPTNQGDGVDLNMIPTILIDRVEIVTGGASASYGSGAIGGAVNILLDHHLEGGKAVVDFGRAARGDGDDRHYAFAWGTAIGRGGHLLLGAEGQNMEAVADCIESRDWCARGAQIQTNPAYAANAEPNYVYRENVRRNLTTTGVFARLGVRLDESGRVTLPFRSAGEYGVGGDGQHVYEDTTLRSDVERTLTYASYRHDFDQDLTFFVDVSKGNVQSFTPQDSIDLISARLAADNFYLSRLAVNPCDGAPADDCRLSKDFSRDVAAENDTRTDLARVTVGFDGRFGDSTWTWDAYFQSGKSEVLQAVYESRHAERFMMALDAVDDGSGNPVCRVARDGFAAVYGNDSTVDPRLAQGCVPINVLGHGNISRPAFDFTHGRILENTYVEQDMLELVASGDVFAGTGAGVVRGAAGFSLRTESIDNPADRSQPDYVRTDYQSQFGESFAGEVHVRESFGELDVPITKRIGLQLAVRRSEYENEAGPGTGIAGRSFEYDIDTWKINGNWQVSDGLRLRASTSRDVRAPNFRELYYRKIFPAGSVFGYCSNEWTGEVSQGYFTFTGDPCVVDLRGGLDLEPEKSDTTTFGFVLTPPQRNFRFAADYYEIRILDAITPASQTLTLESCRLRRDPYFCGQITGTLLDPNDPLGGFSDITHVRPEALNLRSYESRGIDLSADWMRAYRFGTVAARMIASHTIEQLIQPSMMSARLVNVAGVTGNAGGGNDWEPAADWSAQWLTTFSRGPFSVTARARYIADGSKHQDRIGPDDPGFDPNLPNSIDDNTVPSHLIWGLSGAFDFELGGTRMEVFGVVQNLFDRDPPLIGTGIGGTNPIYFDTIGRSFRVGLRASF